MFFISSLLKKLKTSVSFVFAFSSIKSKSPYLRIIKDFNINTMPKSFSFRTDIDRNYNEKIRKKPLFVVNNFKEISKIFKF